jgi:type II secretory pathway pseudopilin PulG
MARVRLRAHIRRAKGDCNESGMTLLELVVAFLIFGILLLGIAHTMGSALSMTRTNRHRSVAANLGAERMDTIRSMDFEDIAASTDSVDIDGITYTVITSRYWVPKNPSNGPCNGNATPALLRVDVVVTWPNMQGIPPVKSETTLTPPVGAYDPGTGHIGVTVLDRESNPVFNAPVTIPGVGTESTNLQGCAFFGFLPAGTYTVSLGTVGWVDRQLNETPSQVVAVAVGDVKAAAFDYDRAAAYDVAMQSDLGYAPPADLPVTVYSPQILPNGLKVYNGTGSIRTITGLFPFLEGYQLWSGQCSDSDPDVWSTGGRGDPLDASAGSITATSVRLKDLEITVVDSLGLPVVGAQVVVEHGDPYATPAPAPDPLCATGASHDAGTTGVAPLGRVDTALPFGEWTARVVGRSPMTDWPTVTLDPNAPGAATTTVQVL